ncbi:hypothetical protein TCAL_01430 [Tigriopus californicus]|uniref:Queuosine 5'-phosphate N-glycosylase/hydrolase n=1 Tax=Tigriopus californicus TaxID=6832 RepID=A0A553NUK8_TIGCA|nr:queuosine 5'-phosphate N-glycosylase/hydrolase-like isoform X2 [Tigriopus californicus]TRY69104.1 hypothetical protein TCAL_01430 [Tigriopus californicus]
MPSLRGALVDARTIPKSIGPCFTPITDIMTKGCLSPRESGELVAKNAQNIVIDHDGVKKCAEFLADRLKQGGLRMEDLFKKTEIHPQSADEAGAKWVFFADVLNFSFWHQEDQPQYAITYKGNRYTGYLSLCAAINRTLDQGIPLTDPDFFGTITEDQLDGYLKGDQGVSCPLIPDRVRCLQEASNILKSKYENSVKNLILSAKGSAQSLLTKLTSDFECFNDSAEFDADRRVSFFKRAQIFISDLWCLFEGQDLGKFEDIDSLTMFADYRVPQSLQYFGAFKYSEALLDQLNTNEELAFGHPFEMEIRGCSIKAVDVIVEEVRKKQLDPTIRVNAILVDYFLWGFRREKAKEMEKFPYHKTRSIYY